jgi:hypothetical protein
LNQTVNRFFRLVQTSGASIVTIAIAGRKMMSPIIVMINNALNIGPRFLKKRQSAPVVGGTHFNPAVGQRIPIIVLQGGVIVIRVQIG